MSHATVVMPEVIEPVVVTLKDIHGDQKSGVMVAFFIPSDAASTIAIDKDVIPGAEVIPPNGLHITLAYLGDISEFPYESDRQRVRGIVGTFAQSHTPLKGAVNGIGQFANATDGKLPFYANFDSPTLPDFRQELVEVLELNGIVISKTHGFTPHITLAYIPEGYATKLPDIPTISIVFDALYLSMGEEDVAYSLGRSKSVVVTLKGGPGSGHRGHAGRPGKRGGSVPGAGGVSIRDGKVAITGGDERTHRLIEEALSSVPDWHLQQMSRSHMERLNTDRLGLREEAAEKLFDMTDHPLTVSVVGDQGDVAGSTHWNGFAVVSTLSDAEFKDTVLHELGHHIDNIVATPRTRPAPVTRFQLNTGGDRLDGSVGKAGRDLEWMLSVHGGGHPTYQKASVRYKRLFVTVPGKRYTKHSIRGRTEIFAEAYMHMAKGQGDLLPPGVAKGMNRYFKKNPPKNVRMMLETKSISVTLK